MIPVRACIALGSNLGDKRANIERAARELRATPGISLVTLSALFETEPVVLSGSPDDHPKYLNAAALLDTTLPPRELLRVMLDIEKRCGRDRSHESRWGPRTLDLDLLLFGETILDEPGLTLPHPRMHERRFVLEPLASIAPHAVHPVQRRTIAELLGALPA